MRAEENKMYRRLVNKRYGYERRRCSADKREGKENMRCRGKNWLNHVSFPAKSGSDPLRSVLRGYDAIKDPSRAKKRTTLTYSHASPTQHYQAVYTSSLSALIFL